MSGLDDLFPVPSLPPSRLSPHPWPGITPSSTAALQAVLKDNHERWHVYFDPRGFHNHTAHFALALWGLGADEDIINAAYKLDCQMCQGAPAFESPGIITAQNFKDHLGDDKYYSAYVKYFTDVVRTKNDLGAVMEEYVFHEKMNFDNTQGSGNRQPDMLNRFLDGLLHPMIHVGYSAEFGVPGLLAEGLAMAAIHRADFSALVPSSFFQVFEPSMSALSLSDGGSTKNTHALTILARVQRDPQFDNKGKIDNNEAHEEAIRKYASEWSYNSSDPREVDRKIEELIWMNTVIYGIGGWSKDKHYHADFEHMHLVTSSLFLASLAVHLKPSSQELLLRGYLIVSLLWYLRGTGRLELDIPGFFSADTAYPNPSGPLPTPNEKAMPGQSSFKAITPNPWLPVIQTALVHPDDHVPKLQRALAHYGTLYGTKTAGHPEFTGTELIGADKLDGTLFIRVAGLTGKRLGRIREGETPLTFWDRRMGPPPPPQ